MKTGNIILCGAIICCLTIIACIFCVSVWINPEISIPNKYFDTGMIMGLWLIISVGTYGVIKVIN